MQLLELGMTGCPTWIKKNTASTTKAIQTHGSFAPLQ